MAATSSKAAREITRAYRDVDARGSEGGYLVASSPKCDSRIEIIVLSNIRNEWLFCD